MQPVDTAPILVDSVYRRIMDAIVDATLLPGERIVQLDLAQQLGVSRAPVSHALQVLKHQGLLQNSGRRGLEVAPIDPDRIRDFYRVRASLDGLAAELAAQRAAAGALPKAEADRVRHAYAAGAKLGDETAMSRRVQADIAFHRSLYRASGNTAIEVVLDPLWPHLQRAMVLVLKADQGRRQSWREHRAILDHVLSGRPSQAQAAAYEHAFRAGINTEAELRQSRR